MSRCLTEAELVELTGRKYAKCQIAVLIERGWKFEIDGNDKPVVLRSYADARQGEPARKRKGPRLDGLSAA